MSEQILQGKEYKAKERHPSFQITKLIRVYEYDIRKTQLYFPLCHCVHDV